LHYFGLWDDPDAALKKYLDQEDALHAGRKPREDSADLTVKELVNQFLTAKLALVESGELANRSWQDYKDACDRIVADFGKGRLVADLGPEDFAELRSKMAKKWGPVTLGNVIQRIRVVCKFAFDNGLLDRPVRYGPGFKRPSLKTLRLHKAKQGLKLFSAEEIRALVEGALVVGKEGPELVQPGPQLKAMILLACNCGFGNADCGKLPRSAVDLERGGSDDVQEVRHRSRRADEGGLLRSTFIRTDPRTQTPLRTILAPFDHLEPEDRERLAQQLFHIEWLGTVDISADEAVNALAKRELGANKVEKATEWLKKFLAEYAYPSEEIVTAAKAAGFTFDNVKEAKARLKSEGLHSTNRGRFQGTWWSGFGEPDKWRLRPDPTLPTMGKMLIPQRLTAMAALPHNGQCGEAGPFHSGKTGESGECGESGGWTAPGYEDLRTPFEDS
jgi:hypothetical protein